MGRHLAPKLALGIDLPNVDAVVRRLVLGCALVCAFASVLGWLGCEGSEGSEGSEGEKGEKGESEEAPLNSEEQRAAEERIAPELPRLEAPVPFWKDGKVQGDVDAVKAASVGNLLFNLGDDWVPFIFSESSGR